MVVIFVTQPSAYASGAQDSRPNSMVSPTVSSKVSTLETPFEKAFKRRRDLLQARAALQIARERVTPLRRELQSPQFKPSANFYEDLSRALTDLAMIDYYMGMRVALTQEAKEAHFIEGRDAGLEGLKINPQCGS